MQILLVNDDGIHAPGLRAMRDVLTRWGDVQVVAPLFEQSGVGHGITYLHPIMVKEIREHDEHYGWGVTPRIPAAPSPVWRGRFLFRSWPRRRGPARQPRLLPR